MSEHTVRIRESSFLMIFGLVTICLALITGWFWTVKISMENMAMMGGFNQVGMYSVNGGKK